MDYITVLFWSLISMAIALSGGFIILSFKKHQKTIVRYALPFGAGTMLATGFASLIPEALHLLPNIESVMLWTFGGFLLFFVMERTLGWFHHHHDDHHHEENKNTKNKSHATLVVIGDTIHSAVDGIVIGAAFLVDPTAGIIASLAVAVHEFAQEIGDFGILLGRNVSPKKVILINVLSGMATVITAVLTYIIGDQLDFNAGYMIAMAAGMFIYVAASDIIPEIHENNGITANKQSVMLLLGVAVIMCVNYLAPHTHETHDAHFDDEHNHRTVHSETTNDTSESESESEHEEDKHEHGDHEHDDHDKHSTKEHTH